MANGQGLVSSIFFRLHLPRLPRFILSLGGPPPPPPPPPPPHLALQHELGTASAEPDERRARDAITDHLLNDSGYANL